MRKNIVTVMFSWFSNSRLWILISLFFLEWTHIQALSFSASSCRYNWDSRPFHPKIYLEIAWLFDIDHGKINKIDSWKCMEVGMNLSAVDRSGLGGWLLKGICSSHHTYFQGCIPGKLRFRVVPMFQKHGK